MSLSRTSVRAAAGSRTHAQSAQSAMRGLQDERCALCDDDAFDLCGVLFPDDPDTKPKAVCEPVGATVILSKNPVLRTKIIEVSTEVLRG